ncbi:MAG: tail fiber domain-containing protein [Bacteroidetes bacterium]|nr:tail fiber domain-containing protein [Bacteroidota bacterium]
MTGNAGTDSTNFIGTTDAKDLIFKTNNTEKLRIAANGNVGIGTTNPSDKFHINIANGTIGGLIVSEGTNNVATLGDASSASVNGVLELFSGGVSAIKLHGSSGEVSYINAGNIGIGTTTAGYKLDIIGPNGLTNLFNLQQGPYPVLRADGSILIRPYPQASQNILLSGMNSGGTFRNMVRVQNSGSGEPTLLLAETHGNVGIGTTNPTYKLSISGGGLSFDQGHLTSRNSNTALEIGLASDGTDGIYFQTNNCGTPDFQYVDRMVIKQNGNIGIGTTSPDQLLSVNGNASKVGGGSWATFSDKRLKKDIDNFSDGLEILEKINPVKFKYNGLAGYPDDGKEYVGIIAQDIQNIAPYMLSIVKKKLKSDDISETDLLMYDSSAMTYILINAVKEQQKEIEGLKKIVEKLIKQNNTFEAKK